LGEQLIELRSRIARRCWFFAFGRSVVFGSGICLAIILLGTLFLRQSPRAARQQRKRQHHQAEYTTQCHRIDLRIPPRRRRFAARADE
jgi:uncharacterized membrane protein YciS (DUF1049 family)